MALLKASDYIARFLQAQEIEYVFEVAGGMITHILDSLYQLGDTKIVSVHHEQASAFAADGYGRLSGKPGVALATSGPGATNLLTGIASCYYDSSPALFITGQVNSHEIKNDKKIRQLGFQETDIVSMAEPITKKCFAVQDAEQIPFIFHTAYELAISDRPGPVLIDIPMNCQSAKINAEFPTYIARKKYCLSFDTETLTSLFEALAESKRPLLLAGRGVNVANAKQQLLEFIALTQIPVVTSLLALDVIPYDHPLRVGFIGSYGNRWANIALGSADFLIVLGSRLDIRQTGADVIGFAKNKIIFHIDCDINEINNRIKNCRAVVTDVADFLDFALKKYSHRFSYKNQQAWLTEINTLRDIWPDTNELNNIIGINPNHFMHSLSKNSQNCVGYVADVGCHQMWAAQSLELSAKQFFITSGGMGAMGFALPAGIGASLAHEKKPVVIIAGDGSFQMNIQELQTIVRNNIPLKIVILNNNSLGMIRQFQDSYFDGRYQSTYWGYSAPNFADIASAYGIPSKTITTMNDIEPAIEWLWQDAGPLLLQVIINPKVNVYPKIAFGKPITEMEPFAIPNSMECT